MVSKMQGDQRNLLLISMLALAIPEFVAFNIDMANPTFFDGARQDFFGYKVFQYQQDAEKGVIVSAPLQQNGTGAICNCTKEQGHKCFNPPEVSAENTTIPVKHFGMSVAPNFERSQFTVCSPSLAHECHDNTYLNSVCYKMSQDLQEIASFKPAFQGCTEKTVNLVFMFDGSGSMRQKDFEENKKFMVNVMDSLKNTSIKFAAVQFASEHRTVFDFNDYQNGRALKKLQDETHLKSLTNTHAALQFVLLNLFDNEDVGASTDATKVVILITDGDPSDRDHNNTIRAYDDEGIIRLVIGVKDVSLEKLRTIASEPRGVNTFRIENYNGLPEILGRFQNKIFNIEGSNGKRAGELTEEMSQAGFNAIQHKETLILGSVGSNKWRGSLLELQGRTETQILDSQTEEDSYLGYSISVGERNNALLYFSGGPRSEHIGQVVLFRHDGKTWIAEQRINGEQIGSYFGAELCSVDIDSDGQTDFLLVGAPLFYQAQEKTEGRLYIYSLTDEMKLQMEMKVSAPALGRFGSSVASLADLNGDGLRDVAVGAPLEDANSGAVYIYLGDRQRGIRSTFSQRISGQKMGATVRLFGLAIDGNMDLGDDDLPDIVVGSQGSAVVLRSRPVFDVTARLTFSPEEIDTDHIDCLGNSDINLNMVNVTACFEMTETTLSVPDEVLGLNISYVLDVDPERQLYRGFFSNTNRKMRSLSMIYELLNSTCLFYPIYMPICVKDTLSPIRIKLNFSQFESESTRSILNVDSTRQAWIEVPFKKECRNNNTCIAELEVDLDFLTPTLLVAEDNYFNLTMRLSNHGDDSYNTSLTIHYPPGLSFSRMVLTKASRPTLHSCTDLEGVLDRTVCGVSLPVYRSRSWAMFKSSFHILTDFEWNETVSFTVSGHSGNLNSTGPSVTKSIPLQFEINMALIVQEYAPTYLNFTTEDFAPKTLRTAFKVDNLGWKSFPINVSLVFPTTLEHTFEVDDYQLFVEENKTSCQIIEDHNSDYCSAEKRCKVITCDTFTLEKESATEFVFSGDVQFKGLKEHEANLAFLKRFVGDSAEVTFKSFIRVDYDEQLYVMKSQKNKNDKSDSWQDNDPAKKQTQVRVEFIIPSDMVLITATGVVLGFLLLLIITIIMFKLGCFKCKSQEDFEEEDQKAALVGGSAGQSNGNGSGTAGNGKEEPDLENEVDSLLEKDKAGDPAPDV